MNIQKLNYVLQFKNIHQIFILSVVVLISGCATTNQAPFPVQQYQDLTSRYNAYFNAKEKMKVVMQGADKAVVDRYEDVIPLFIYNDKANFATYSGDLDDIEKRCAKSIQIHKFSNYVDDHFLLISKANFLKGDYDKALQNLKFITTEYKEGVDYVKEMKRLKGKNVKPSKKKKPKKKPKFEKVLDEKGNLVLQKIDERPKYSLFVHEPARAEALVWTAKSYTAKKQFTEAASIINYAKNDDQFYKNLDKQLLLTEANLYMEQKDYRSAITDLEKFLSLTKKKRERIRPLIALAQMYERVGDFRKSADYYQLAQKSNPSYEAEFFAKIQQARLLRRSKSGFDTAKQLLTKLARDGKNKDHLDEIFYEQGEIALLENNKPVAKDWYQKSVNSSTKNVEQKSQSYLRMGQLTYDEELYSKSKFFYDSTMLGLPAKDTAYAEASTRARVLGELVKQLDIIYTEDSLQKLAKMSPRERDRVMRTLLANKEKEEEKKNENINLNPLSDNQTTTSNNNTNVGGGGWYFYNAVMKNNGYTEFLKRWGKRKLEENWRRKDKSSNVEDIVETKDGKQSEDGKGEFNKDGMTDIEKMEDNIPLTQSQLDLSNTKLVEAYYQAAVIYKDNLKNDKKATQKLEELLKRFPQNKLRLEALYQLLILSEKNGKAAKAAECRTLIINEFPESKIAKYLMDKDYFNKLKAEENALNTYYQTTYEAFLKGDYAAVDVRGRTADVEYKPNPLKPKFDLLNALSLSKQNRLDDYVQELNKIIAKHASTPEGETAKELLASLNSSKLPMKDISKEAPPAPVEEIDTVVKQTPITEGTIPAPAKPAVDSTKIEKKVEKVVEKKEEKKEAKVAEKKEEKKEDKKPVKPESIKETTKPETPKTEALKPEEVKPKVDPIAPLVTAPVIVETINADKNDKEEVFGKSDMSPHNVVIYYRNAADFENGIFGKLDAFHAAAVPDKKLTNRSVFIDNNNKLIVIKPFMNKDDALAYIAKVKTDVKKATGLDAEKIYIFAINTLNYSTLITNKRIGNYLNFYEENYK